MTVFNSLGSNYTLGDAVSALRPGHDNSSRTLLTYLEKRYGGKAYLTYKGRHAISLALSVINKRDYLVGICGFTCYAVYEAVASTGYKHVYLDIDESLHFTHEIFLKMIHKYPNMKILIIQNTLGYPMDVRETLLFARQNGIIIIEDLAHSIGCIYDTGQEGGTAGDFTILSFSQDKMIDAVSGGALIIRSTHYAKNIVSENHTPIPKERMLKDRLYPLFTWLIRHMYASSTGKILHLLLKKMHALPNPMDVPKASCGYVLADSYAVMVRKEYAVLEDNLAHRRSIANMYASRLPKDVLISSIRDKIYRGSCLRFPVFVKDPKAAVLALAKKGIYISDTWYDSPVGPGRYLGLTDYAGQCPSSEKICRKILNLPTHINVSEVKARDICDALTAFLKQA